MRRGCCFNRACFAGRERAIERLRGPALSGRRGRDCDGRLWVCDTHGSAPATWEWGTSIRRYFLRLLGPLLSKRRQLIPRDGRVERIVERGRLTSRQVSP